MLKVVQCWDDGVIADIRLTGVLRKHNARASFNLNFDCHKAERQGGWMYKDKYLVQRLAKPELLSVYEGFTIANHGLTHKGLARVSEPEVIEEVYENRKRLQDHFQQPIDGYCYAGGNYNEFAMRIVEEAGHCYARTTKNALPTLPAEHPMAFHSTCKFDDAEFWSRYERSKTEGGVFYFWGHSYELITEDMWSDIEDKVQRITQDPEAEWVELPSLFQ